MGLVFLGTLLLQFISSGLNFLSFSAFLRDLFFGLLLVIVMSLRVLGGNRIYVVGKVNRPGEYPFSRPLDIMQSLGLAGGATPFAALNDIRILRRENGKQVAIPFKYEEVERGRNLDQNILLKSGDTVVVP